MSERITQKRIAKNVMLSVAAQFVSFALSFLLHLIVPKFIDELQYSYWQTYALYAFYVPILQFGIVEGIMLRYAQYNFDEIDKSRLRSQFLMIVLLTSVLAGITAIIGLTVCEGVTRFVVVVVAVNMVTKNIVLYSSCTFQITNRINRYAVLLITQKFTYGLIVGVLLIAGVKDFYWYCIADVLGDAAAIALSPFLNRGMYFGKSLAPKAALRELGANMGAGIMLMTANYSAILLTTGARVIAQWRWDPILFGKISLAFSVTNMFLNLVQAVSIVLFPSLKRLDEESLPKIYKNIRDAVSPILFFTLLLYFPGCWILNRWLPAYSQSFPYLGILLPLIVFSSKVSLLTNNYLKVYRKEKLLLAVNVVSALLGIVAFLLSAYVFQSVTALLCCVVAVVMLNSVATEIIASRLIRVRLIKDFVIEAVMSVGFILIVSFLGLGYGCLAYAGLFVLYCAVNYKYLIGLFQKLFHKKSAAPQDKTDGGSSEQ